MPDPGVQKMEDTQLAISLAKYTNDFLAEQIQRKPKLYGGFAHLPMQDPKAAAAGWNAASAIFIFTEQ